MRWDASWIVYMQSSTVDMRTADVHSEFVFHNDVFSITGMILLLLAGSHCSLSVWWWYYDAAARVWMNECF